MIGTDNRLARCWHANEDDSRQELGRAAPDSSSNGPEPKSYLSIREASIIDR